MDVVVALIAEEVLVIAHADTLDNALVELRTGGDIALTLLSVLDLADEHVTLLEVRTDSRKAVRLQLMVFIGFTFV